MASALASSCLAGRCTAAAARQRQCTARPGAAPWAALPSSTRLAPLRTAAAHEAGSRHLQHCNRVWQQQQQRSRRLSALPSDAADSETPAAPPLLLCSSDDEPVPPYSPGEADRSSSSSGSGDGAASGSDGEGGSVQIDLQLPRRSLLVQFTCNRCEGRSERLVNPVAWERGMVIAQCQHCNSWHKLADAANLVEEIRYADLEDE